MPRTPHSFMTRSGQRGFSLVELSIAVLIAVFLLGGLVTLVMGTRRTNATQGALSQLQDNQRIAMTLINNIVQKAGYFPNPVTQSLATTFAAETLGGVSMVAGQALGGTHGVSDTMAVRFFTPPNDSTNGNAVINCAGQSNSVNSFNVSYNNLFQINTVSGTSWLQCQVRTNNNGTLSAVQTINLIPNVTNMIVLYGVGTSAASNDYSILHYLNATQVTATGNWLNISAVKVTLTFTVPQYGPSGTQLTTPLTAVFTRVIPVMSRGGVEI